MKFLVAARKEGKIQTPNKDFDDEETYHHILFSFLVAKCSTINHSVSKSVCLRLKFGPKLLV